MRSYDATLCDQALREHGAFLGSWNQGRPLEMRGLVEKEENIKCGPRGSCQIQEFMEWGECSRSQNAKEREKSDEVIQLSQVAVGSASEGTLTMGINLSNSTQHVGFQSNMGQTQGAHLDENKTNENELDFLLKNMDGSLSVLRAQREKLLKQQAKYWWSWQMMKMMGINVLRQ